MSRVEWLGQWRADLVQQRDTLTTELADLAVRRRLATEQLAILAPVLGEAKAAYAPYANAIGELERLQQQLQPALRLATSRASTAGFGHRKQAQRAVNEAGLAIENTTDQIANVRNRGSDAKALLDRYRDLEKQLTRTATPSQYFDPDQTHIDHHNKLIAAIDTWHDWNQHHPVNDQDLAEAVNALAQQADVRGFTIDTNGITPGTATTTSLRHSPNGQNPTASTAHRSRTWGLSCSRGPSAVHVQRRHMAAASP